MGPLAFGRKDGDDAKMHVPLLGQFGVGDVNQMTAKFTPEGMKGQKANGGTFDIDDEKGPQLGYMDRETTMGERSGSTGKMSILGLGNIEMGDVKEQGTGLLDFSKSLFPFLELPALKNETENVRGEHSQVDPTYTEYYYPKPRSYLGSSYDVNRPQIGTEQLIPLGKNKEDIEFPKLVTEEPTKKYSNPFDSVQIRPRIHAAVTKNEDTTPLLTAEHKVAQVTTRKSIHEVGLSTREIYALCAKFAPMANQHCYKSKVEEQFLERCRGYQKDCVEFIAKARPLGAIANSFSSGVGLTYYDWNVNGIPYYPINEEGSIGNGHHGKVDFGTWGGGYSDNLGVRDFWSQTQEYGANWYEGQYGYKTGWSIPIVQGIGVEGGQGAQVSVPIKEGELGKPITVTNGYHVGPFMGLADRVGVDWLNGGVSWNKGFAVPFVGVGVNTGTAVGFPSVGMIMNRMGMDSVETLNTMARAAAAETAQVAEQRSTLIDIKNI
uniref:Ntox44 domain-containing protein n=1 Tax=Caenorhabditis tropicalis TaxID=1561998 RepID=A0A1I7TG14_9PELO